MDYKLFFKGVTYLLIAYATYRFVLKGEEPSSKENNWVGMTMSNYIGLGDA